MGQRKGPGIPAHTRGRCRGLTEPDHPPAGAVVSIDDGLRRPLRAFCNLWQRTRTPIAVHPPAGEQPLTRPRPSSSSSHSPANPATREAAPPAARRASSTSPSTTPPAARYRAAWDSPPAAPPATGSHPAPVPAQSTLAPTHKHSGTTEAIPDHKHGISWLPKYTNFIIIQK